MFGKKSIAVTIIFAAICVSPNSTGEVTIHGTVVLPGTDSVNAVSGELLPLLDGYHSGWLRLEKKTYLEPIDAALKKASSRFCLSAPQPGIAKVVVGVPGFVPMQLDPLMITDSLEVPPVALLANAGATFEVRKPNGEPLAGVWVFADGGPQELWQEVAVNGWHPQPRIGLTDADGKVTFSRAPGEQLEVTVFVPGSVGEKRTGVTGGVLKLSSQSDMGRVIEVHDPDGAPRGGILVRAGELAWPIGVTGDDGRLRIAGTQEKIRIWLFTSDGWRQAELLEPVMADSGEPVVVTLCEPVRLSGQVVDALSRRPLAGAFVWPGYEPAHLVRTDAEGNYELLAPGRQPFWFQAEAPGYLPLAQKITTAEPGLNQAPTLALIPAAAASGRVVDNAGKPVAGARIEARLRFCAKPRHAFRLDRAASRAVSGAEGDFRLSGLSPEASYELRVSREGFSTATETLSGLVGSKTRSSLRIVLRHSRPAYGWVVDPEEHLVSGAEVVLSAAAEARGRQGRDRKATAALQATTDRRGRFEIADVPAPEVDLTVKMQGFSEATVRGIKVLPGKEPVDLGTVILRPGVTIRGRVIDSEDQPLAEAVVILSRDLGRSDQALIAWARRQEPAAGTDAAGWFTIRDLPRGEAVNLVIRCSGYLPASVHGVEAPHPEPLMVVLQPAGRIVGEVVDYAGEPIAGVEVSFETTGGEDGSEWAVSGAGTDVAAVSDEVGKFILDHVRPGRGEVNVFATGFQPATVRDLEIPAGTTIEDLRIVLEPGAVLAGRVLTAEEEPVADARVTVGASSAVSDAAGAYRMTGLLLGSQALEVYHRDYGLISEEVTVAPGVNTRDLIFQPAHAVTGQVLEEEGWLLMGAMVSLQNAIGRWCEYRTLTAEDGSFRLAPVADGEYTLRAEKDGYASTKLEERIVVAGGPVGDLEVRLTRGGTITGRVLGLDFDELAEVEIWAKKGDEEGTYGRVDYEGNYEVSHLAPGDWLVRASLRSGSREAVERVPLAPGEEVVTRDLVFGTDLRLSGRVIYGDEPLVGASVSLRGHDVAGTRSVATDYEGSFEIRELKPGSYCLQVSSSGLGFTHSQELDLFSDRELLIEIATARVRGRVVETATSQALPEAWVLMRRMAGTDDAEAAFLIAIATESDGSFDIPRVTPGRYRLTARKDGYAAREEILEVPSGFDLEGLELALAPTAGLRLDVRLASGRRPRSVSLGLIDSAGRTVAFESRNLDDEGVAHFPTVGPGRWSLLLSAPGGATTAATAEVPGEPVGVVMPEEAQLRVRVPELVSSNHVATLTLTSADGWLFRGIHSQEGVRDRWPVAGGQATVDALPPGLWTLNVSAPDGASWVGSVVAEAGRAMPVTCTGGQCFALAPEKP